jgi:N-acetylglucosaminyldiphosphoundecaprenol N-acetyl-beta-D-mannosaminyltransferase
MVKMNNKVRLPTTRLFDLDICATSFELANACLLTIAKERGERAQVVVTPNVDHVVRLSSDPELKNIYAQSDFIFPDGMPIVWASRMTNTSCPERVTGADLFVSLMRAAALEGLSVCVIGGMPGQEKQLTNDFNRLYPGANVSVFCPSMQFDPIGAEGLATIEYVNAVKPDLLFVCLGMPKQERWALTHRSVLATPIILCVGAAMEFALGFKSRAPRWVQTIGMEWGWRLCSEPKRLWRRYMIQGAKFFPLCLREWHQQRKKRY